MFAQMLHFNMAEVVCAKQRRLGKTLDISMDVLTEVSEEWNDNAFGI